MGGVITVPNAATIRPRFIVHLAAVAPAEVHEFPIAVCGSWVKNGQRFSISFEDLNDIKRNFEHRKNGRVVVDYEHASERPRVAAGKAVPAAGWIESIDVRGGTLFAGVRWTGEARKLIAAEEYKFVSPAIDFDGHDKETGESTGAVLTSLALTNHPFLEELPPLMLSGHAVAMPRLLLSEVGATDLADVDPEKVIQVPLPQVEDGDTKIKVKVKVEKKGSGDDGKADLNLADEEKCKLCGKEHAKDVACESEQAREDHGAESVELSDDAKTYFASLAELELDDEKHDPKKPYGEVPYADPGYQEDKKKRYPVDTEAHIRPAWNYIAKAKNAGKYSADQLKKIKSKIVSAWKKTIDPEGPPSAVVATELLVDGKAWKVPYTVSADGVELGRPVEVRVEASEVTKMADNGDVNDTSDREKAKMAETKKVKMDDPDDHTGADYGDQEKERKKTEDRAAAISDVDDSAEDAVLAEQFRLDDKTGEPAASIPRLKIRKVTSGDGVGKMKHHALINKGRLVGYLTNGDVASYTEKNFPQRKEMLASERRSALTDELREITGRPRLTLDDVAENIEFAITHKDAAVEQEKRTSAFDALFTKLSVQGNFSPRSAREAHRMLLTDHSLGIDAEDAALFLYDFQDAVEEVNEYIKSGRFLPLMRKDLIKLYLTDKASFLNVAKNMPTVVDLRERGIGGSGEEGSMSAQEEVHTRTIALMKEKNMEESQYGAACSEVKRSNPQLAKRYQDEVRRVQ